MTHSAQKASSQKPRIGQTNDWASQHGLGKLPPQAIELEVAVLGAMLLESEPLDMVIDLLKPSDFYLEKHQIIFTAIATMHGLRQKVDMLTVTQYLRATGGIEFVGGGGYITELTMRISSSANIEEHCRIVQEKSIRRGLIAAGANQVRDAYDESIDPFALLEAAEKAVSDVTSELRIARTPDFAEQLHRTIEKMKIADTLGGITGVPSEYDALNNLLYGYQAKCLYLIGARPSMGKSLFMLNEAVSMLYKGYRVAIFSLEMSDIQQNERILSLVTGIDSAKIMRGQLSPSEWALVEERRAELAQLPLFLYDLDQINPAQIKSELRKLKRKGGIDIAFVDYLQLIEGESSNNNRTEEISKISRSLKVMAKQLEIPVVALSQLSRALETRSGDHKPQLSDLRESGSLEQDADCVMFLYRPYYYNITQDEAGLPTEKNIHVIVTKNRPGKLGEPIFNYEPAISAITERYTVPEVRQNVGF